MKILVTGTEGYLGSLLAPLLMEQGHEVTGVDTGFYQSGLLYHASGDRPKTLIRDIRLMDEDDLRGHDAVVHMAELSNDPAGALNPSMTYAINHEGSVRLARLARQAGVRRFIYMSSCSVYGVADNPVAVTEQSPVNPQTAYAECKVRCEQDIGGLANPQFSPVFLRNATAFGASPRQRFDVVVNNLCGRAWTTKTIEMTSDGSPWRPLVHGLDIAQAIHLCLEAPREAIHRETFNVGSNCQNYRIREVAEIIKSVFPDCRVSFGSNGSDNRSYRVNFDKITRHLPQFSCQWDVERGAKQFRTLFEQIELTPGMFGDRAYTRLAQLEYLLRTAQIDRQFYWAADPAIPRSKTEAQLAANAVESLAS